MKKLINNPVDYVDECLDGLMLSHPCAFSMAVFAGSRAHPMVSEKAGLESYRAEALGIFHCLAAMSATA
ncbi:hypothetical protein [Mesorhizobium sp. M0520]|uniref:hypothetical protein n=1 Tax=Mesorhizobium sp. M0520 TaxID=2956957 RepID=UPI003335D7EF